MKIDGPLMKYQKLPLQKYTYTCQFDFDIGYLVESPCRCCEKQDDLPQCARSCHRLDRVRGILADSISCTRRR
jgi:hypothetical protein